MAHVDTVPMCRGSRPVRRGRWIVPADKNTGLGADDRAGAAVVLHGRAGDPPRRPAPSAADVPLDRPGRDRPARGAVRQPGPAGQAGVGVQLRRRPDRKGDHRRHRRLSHGDPHHRPRQPCRRGPREGRQRHRHRRAGHCRIAQWRLARPDRARTAARHQQHRRDSRRRRHQRGHPAAEIRAEARSHDPAFRRQIVRAIERAFREAARRRAQQPGRLRQGELRGRLDYESFRLADDEPSVLAAEAAIRALGGDPSRVITNGGLDANWMTARGIPTVTLGCGQMDAHTTAERLDLDEFQQGCRLRCGWLAADETWWTAACHGCVSRAVMPSARSARLTQPWTSTLTWFGTAPGHRGLHAPRTQGTAR